MTKFKIGDEIGKTSDPSTRGIVIGFLDNETYYIIQRRDGTNHGIQSYDIENYYSLYVPSVVYDPYVQPVPEKNLLWIIGIIILFIFMMR